MKKLLIVSCFSIILLGFSATSVDATFEYCIQDGASRGEIYSNDFKSESDGHLSWKQGSSDEIYMYLENRDSAWDRNTNAEIKLYSKDSDGSYTFQKKVREENVPLWDEVELKSTVNWYSGDTFKGHYYYTWISGGAHSLFSEGY